MLRHNLLKLRVLGETFLLRIRASCRKPAAWLRIDGRGDLPLQKLAFLLGSQHRNRHRVQKRLGIRMETMFKNIIGGGKLHDLSKIHYKDIVGDMLYHGHVVGDKHICQAPLLLQILH